MERSTCIKCKKKLNRRNMIYVVQTVQTLAFSKKRSYHWLCKVCIKVIPKKMQNDITRYSDLQD